MDPLHGVIPWGDPLHGGIPWVHPLRGSPWCDPLEGSPGEIPLGVPLGGSPGCIPERIISVLGLGSTEHGQEEDSQLQSVHRRPGRFKVCADATEKLTEQLANIETSGGMNQLIPDLIED